MNPYLYSLTVLKVLCKRATFLSSCYRWSLLHEVEVDYHKQFSSVSRLGDIEQKRIFLEATTLITNIRYKVIEEEILQNDLPILKLLPHPALLT